MDNQTKWGKLISQSYDHWGVDNYQIALGPLRFIKVGHNSTHEFYVCLLGNFWLVYSFYADVSAEEREDEHLKAYPSFEDMMEKAYLGHL